MVSFASHLNNNVLTQRLMSSEAEAVLWLLGVWWKSEIMNISGTLQGRSCQNLWARSPLSTWAEELWNSSTCESGARREDGSGLEQLCTNKHGLSFFHLLALSIYIYVSLWSRFCLRVKKIGYRSNCDFKSHFINHISQLQLYTSQLWLFFPVAGLYLTNATFLSDLQLYYSYIIVL